MVTLRSYLLPHTSGKGGSTAPPLLAQACCTCARQFTERDFFYYFGPRRCAALAPKIFMAAAAAAATSRKARDGGRSRQDWLIYFTQEAQAHADVRLSIHFSRHVVKTEVPIALAVVAQSHPLLDGGHTTFVHTVEHVRSYYIRSIFI